MTPQNTNKMQTRVQILQKMFLKYNEFDPLLTPEQYQIYTKHLEEVIKELQ